MTKQTRAIKTNTLNIFLSYLKPYYTQIAVALLALLFSAFIILLVGFGLQKFVDQGLQAPHRQFINPAFIFLIICALILAGAALVRMTTTSWLSEQVTQDIRRDLFRHLLTFDALILEDLKTSDLISRLENDTALIRSALSSSVAVALRSFIQILGSVIFLFMTSLKLTGFVLLVIPLCSLPLIFLGRRVRLHTANTHTKQQSLSIFIHETLRALRTIQAFCQESGQAQRFEDLSACYLKATHLKGRSRALIVASIIAIVFGSIALTLWIGAQDVFQGKISFGQLSAFIFYAVVAAGSLNSLSDVSGEMMSAIQGFKRIYQLKELRSRFQIKTTFSELAISDSQELTVDFKDVTFFYPSRPKIPALHRLSFKIKAGQTVAIVGPSGAGKSTLFQLLLRFYDPQEGQILIENQDIQNLSLPNLRSLFAQVPQEPDIFDLSLQDNIAFSRPKATCDEIYEAADLALVNEFVSLLPQGYETMVGEQGIRLSGGQKQRLAIARAVLYQAPILLLDEATNALDAESEYSVQKALDLAFKGRTRLVIAHRLATVVHADHILVLDQGHLVEQGRHQDLIQQNGLYAHLAKHQFSHASQ
ncbi:MAG: ABC transporter transmembrane domain-containing protein [Janthinobacterium lividum]